MKILILVLSSQKPPYGEMMQAQQETWDSIAVDYTKTIYYYGEDLGNVVSSAVKRITDYSYELSINCSDDYDMMHWKFKRALDILKDENYDFIFRTNSSSYVNKKLLREFAQCLPTSKCYCGIDGGGFASGSGVFLSRDCIDILVSEYDTFPSVSEDSLMGGILNKHGIQVTKGAKRIDINHTMNHCEIENKCYHYRCKHPYDRKNDMLVMKKIFETHEGSHIT